MSLELRIKTLSLLAETRIIQREERKLRTYIKRIPAIKAMDDERDKWVRQHDNKLRSIRSHRYQVVGHELRLTLIARAFIKGLPYTRLEPRVRKTNQLNDASWTRVLAMVSKYGMGYPGAVDKFIQWREDGKRDVILVP
jgi:hypothetical protein